MPSSRPPQESSSGSASTVNGEIRPPSPPPREKNDKEKLIPPPPIIGPDGKEIPRPKDAAGRPLPIYVNSKKEPILDEHGRPIPLRFGDDGKPIPLDPETRRRASSGVEPPGERPVVAVERESRRKIPSWLIWVGAIDIFCAIVVGIYYANKTFETFKVEQQKQDATLQKVLVAITVLVCISLSFGLLPIFAAKKNKGGFVGIWALLVIILLVAAVSLYFQARNDLIEAVVYASLRALMSAIILCISFDNGESSAGRSTGNYRYVANSGTRSGTVNVASTVLVQNPAYVPAYGYGYGYPYGGYYGGYYGSGADAALLGFAAGSMLGGGYGGYGYGYGYDDWGYGGFGGDYFDAGW